ncbi:hypothetical protein BDR07DRAFT_1407350 [Suillus spraguei]|nr:hypothetical protein BDR07DRAFT_1407350 [Suillus spraguei]
MITNSGPPLCSGAFLAATAFCELPRQILRAPDSSQKYPLGHREFELVRGSEVVQQQTLVW